MSNDPGHISVGPLASWPDDRLEKAWRLLAGTVQELNRLDEGDPGRAGLAAAERDAALFGGELVRRGRI